MVLLPAIAAVTAVTMLAFLGRRLELELAGLRRSLRLAGAAAVAADELARATVDVRRRALSTRQQTRRLRRSRPVGSRHPR